MYPTIKTVALVIAVALLTFASATSFAQTNRFSISLNSLTTNFNYGRSNDALQPYKRNFKGLQAGISYQIGISKQFSVVPELYYATKGGTLSKNNPLTESRSTLRLYTLDMPVLARLHCKNLYLNAGPYVGYTMGGRLKTEWSPILPETSSKVSFGKTPADFNRWDFGLLVGAGYDFNMKRTIMTLDARYGYGFASMSRDVERYNRMLNISLVVSKNTHGHALKIRQLKTLCNN